MFSHDFVYCRISARRCLSNSAPLHARIPTDSHNDHRDTLWPHGRDEPTPYEIFGIASTVPKVDHKSLKQKYYQYAKLYHPDVCHCTNVPRHTKSGLFSPSVLLSAEEKMHRFQLITHAYDILRDPRKRNLYDINNGVKNGSPYSYPDSQHYAYYSAGTWEDFQNLHNEDKGRLNVWVFLSILGGLLICIKGNAFLNRLEDTLYKREFTQEETELHLTDSYFNYGLDTDKWSRLRRFLWFRAFSMYRSKEDLDREAEKNERLIRDLQNR